MVKPSLEKMIAAFARALGKKEGWYDKAKRPTLAQKLFNPAMLRHWRQKTTGEPYPDANGFVEFPECEREGCRHADHPAETGWRAARVQTKINVLKRGLSFLEFFAGRRGLYDGFANAREKNDPEAYARFVVDSVCRELGIDARCSNPDCDCQRAVSPRCVNAIPRDLAEKEGLDAAARRKS